MKKLITVIDDFLTDEENDVIISHLNNKDHFDDCWKDPGQIPLIDKMIDASGVKHYIGYEMHFNIGWRGHVEGHQDKDEKLFKRTGELVFPIISLVYYPVYKGTGGELLLYDEAVLAVKPKRLIIFDSSIFHAVNEVQGERISLGINPWDRNITI